MRGALFDEDGPDNQLHPKVTFLHDYSDIFEEVIQLQELLLVGRALGGTHFAIIDADEVASATLIPAARGIAAKLQHGEVATVPMLYIRENWMVPITGPWSNRDVAWIFADRPDLAYCGDQFHLRMPVNHDGRLKTHRRNAGILHLWGLDECRLIAKTRLIKMVERVRWPHKPLAQIEQRYSGAVRVNEETRVHLSPGRMIDPDLLAKHLHLDRDPWQIAFARKLIAEYGRDYFKGLDLFEDLLPL